MKRLRFLILNTDYPEYLRWLYRQNPGLENASYKEQMRVRNKSLFGTADFYSSNLKKLGHEALDIHVNNEFMQRAWMREHSSKFDSRSKISRTRGYANELLLKAANTPLRYLKPLAKPFIGSPTIYSCKYNAILEAQIKYYNPDIILNHAINEIKSEFFNDLKQYYGLLIGQHAAAQLSESEDFSNYDLIITSFMPTVQWFKKRGVKAEIFKLGFEESILPQVNGWRDFKTKKIDVSFVGSFFDIHSSRTDLLETICKKFPRTKIWGPGIEHLPLNSQIRNCYQGRAWGHDMYRILGCSKITINHHGNVLPYANNMRLYESTGMCALLITDWKNNLSDMFNPDEEVIGYRTSEECAELINYYLKHDNEREVIARAGQRRTLSEHTYYQRMQELEGIITEYI